MPERTPDPDSADDLHGFPPRDPALCPGCRRVAEPFARGRCWSCTQDLKAAAPARARRMPTGAGRPPGESSRPRPVSPVYTRGLAGGR